MSDWVKIADKHPPAGLVVETKIDDQDGIRNVRDLRHGYVIGSNLWFTPDGSMYVYYTPTHWRMR